MLEGYTEPSVMTTGTIMMHQLFAYSLDFLPMVIPVQSNAVFTLYNTAGAIAITGGLYSNNSLPVVIERVECSGSEKDLMECSITNEDSSQCDHRQTAAIACHGKKNYSSVQ